MRDRISRRNLFAGALAATPLAKADVSTAEGSETNRPRTALQIRQDSARLQSQRLVAAMDSNEDEITVANYAACYSKGLPQTDLEKCNRLLTKLC